MDEMWALLDHVDLLGALYDGLDRAQTPTSELTVLEPGVLRLHDAASGCTGELAAEALRTLCSAGLTALAARLLLLPGAVTVGVAGPRSTSQWHVGVLGRYVTNVSHVALFTPDHPGLEGMNARVRDQLDLDGISLSPASSIGAAVLGATLVITLGRAGGRIGYEQLARGSVLVMTDDQVVTADVHEGATRRYTVDDLFGVLLGERPGRTERDEILLVTLPDQARSRELEVALAHRFIQSASRLGVGIRSRNGAPT